MIRTDYGTTAFRVLIAFLVGSGFGATLIVLVVVAPLLRHELASVGPIEWITQIVVGYWLIAFVFCAAGLLIAGAPTWWLLHRLHLRSWIDASIVGFAVSFIGYVAFSAATQRLAESSTMISQSILVAILGAIIGFVVWRVAYRRV
jgi:hypothetical protein